ncbi:MAG: OmpA family protein [Bacteroidales bacterium]|nr:OmpA family protein [Bacteroidales bacterium]
MKNKKNIVLLLLMLSFNVIFSQENVKIIKSEFKIQKDGTSNALKNIKYGDFFFEQHTQGSYDKALKFYLLANNYNSNNAELNYKIGVCYLESVSALKSLDFLKKAQKLKDNVASDILFYLGKAYHANYQFDTAITYYQQYKQIASNEPIKIKNIDKKIQECEYGKILISKANDVLITNLGILNTKYKDYASLLSADGSKMYFSSRRPNTTGDIDPQDDQYFEDIYFSQNDSTGWSSPVNVSSLNTPGHDDAVGISADGNTLILYKNGDLYFSSIRGDEWSQPKAFPKQINSNQIESSACFSLNGSTLFFVRGKSPNQLQSNGDIYMSKRDSTGKWSDAVKLPDNINSEYDEDGLFMFADGKTLYYSSKGHNSMGGYDIFKTTLNADGTFSDPENLGFPINTPNNDIYFVMEPNNRVGYYTSQKADALGYTDIYQILIKGKLFLSSEDNLLASIADPINETNMASKVVIVIKGVVIDENTGQPIDAEISIIDNNTNQVIYSTTSNSQNGQYSVTVPVGKNYGMVIRKDGYMFQSENFDLVSTTSHQQITKNIQIQSINVNSTTTLNNIFFDFGSINLKNSSIPELDRVVQFMKDNPTVKIEISGHTDNIGTYDENIILSQQRAEAVALYISNKGISKDRILSVGKGYSTPVADNNTADGRQKNRRVEFKIIGM